MADDPGNVMPEGGSRSFGAADVTPSVTATAASDEERFDYGDRVAYQRGCPDCDKGLLSAPVRFCGACGGTGYLVRWVEVPNGE